MKLIIAGCRDFHDEDVFNKAFQESPFKIYLDRLEIVCGMAPGADTLGKKFAEKNSLKIHKFQADWKKLGRAAGPIRNRQMAEFADSLFAFWDGKSRGTKNMIDEAINNNLYLYVYKIGRK